MAIWSERYDLLVTHVPKTGGIFVERFLRQNAGGRRRGQRHSSYRRLRLPVVPSVRAFIVREPLGWYRSYWAYARSRVRHLQAWPIWDDGSRRHPTYRLDATCGSRTFEGFVVNVLKEFPEGFVRSMYCDYSNGCTHVLRTEHLNSDFEQLLRLVGFESPDMVRAREPVNVTGSRWIAEATLSDELAARVREVDNLDGLVLPYVDRA